jgi:ABC-2 type transport system permease protein
VTALLRAELLKLRTTRTFVALSAVALAISLLLTGLTALLSEPTAEDVLIDVFASDTSSLFILVLAIVGITGEWRHRTISASLLAAPDRARFLAAKTLAFASAGVLLSLVISLGVTILGFSVLSARDLPTPDGGELITLLARSAVVAGLLGALGVAVGALVRNQAIAIVSVLLLSFAVEPAIIALVPDVGRFGPMVGLPMAATGIPASAVGFEDVAFLAPGLAALAMAAWAGALFAAGAALLRRRDVE